MTMYNNNISGSAIKIPEAWNGLNPGKTRTNLFQDYKKDFIPHPSFDIDGDGIVGGRDLVIAKIFDKDKDGKLNAQEKQNAIEALKKGYEKQFMWGVEASGPNRSYRVLQKRGKIWDSDDFGEIKDTYPSFPTSKAIPVHKSIQKLKKERRKEDRERLEQQKSEWDKKHPSSVSRPYIMSEFLVENPKHTSLTQLQEELKRKARLKAGLRPEGDFSVDDKLPPSLTYVATPHANGKKNLDEIRKRANLTELKKIEAKQGKVDIGIDRLLK